MRLLLDTHVALWALADPGRLPARARRAIERESHRAVVSVASVWEAAIKHALGKLTLPEPPDRWLVPALQATGFELLAIQAEHALVAGGLPPHHADPFDRMLVAQALCEGYQLVTADERLGSYGVRRLWA